MVRDKFDIDLFITRCSMEASSRPMTSNAPTYLRVDPELKIALTVTKDHDGWGEHIDLEYSISGDDLEDSSLVDELIGGDLKKYDMSMRQTLRLAFIIYDGIRCGMTGKQKKEYTDKGWLPRVISAQRHSYIKDSK